MMMQSQSSTPRKAQFDVEEAHGVDPAHLLAIQLEAIRGLGPTGYRPLEIRAWCEAAEEEHRLGCPPQYRTHVARIDGHLAGYGRVDDEGFIGALYVKPGVVGRGLGTALLETMEQVTWDLHRQQVVVLASINAVEFYRRRGFSIISKAFFDHPGGIRLATVEMAKARPALRAVG